MNDRSALEEDEDGVLLDRDLPLLSTPVLVGRTGAPSPPPLHWDTGTTTTTTTNNNNNNIESTANNNATTTDEATDNNNAPLTEDLNSRSTRSDSILSTSPTDESILLQQEMAQARKQNERFCKQHHVEIPRPQRRPTEQFMEEASMSVVLVENEDILVDNDTPTTQRNTWTSVSSSGSLPEPPPLFTGTAGSIQASFRGQFDVAGRNNSHNNSSSNSNNNHNHPPRLRSTSTGDDELESLTPRLPPRRVRGTVSKPAVTVVSLADVGPLLVHHQILESSVVVDTPARLLHALVTPLLTDPRVLSLATVQALWEAQGTAVPLPEASLRLVPPDTPLIKLLAARHDNNLPLLLSLPLPWGRALLRLVVRLLTHEDDAAYNAVCLESSDGASRNDGSLWTDPDHASRKPHLLYAVVRWRCGWPEALPTVAYLTETAAARPALHGWLPALARLAGVLATASVTPAWLRRWMNLLQTAALPLRARLCLVRTLTTAAAGAAPPILAKPAPPHFFVLHNPSSSAPPSLARSIKGLTAWPFRNDFGMATWFRLEEQSSNSQKATLLRVHTDEGAGLAVTLVPRTGAFTIAVTVTHAAALAQAPETLEVQTCVLLPRVWYHVAVRHTRSRLKGVFSLSTRQQLSIQLDGKTILNESLTFPRLGRADEEAGGTTSALLAAGWQTSAGRPSSRINLHLQVGHGFDGQMGAMYIFKESVSDASFRALYEATGGKDRAVKKSTSLGGGWDSRHSDIVRKSRVLDIRLKNDDAEEIVLSQRKSYLNRRRGLQDKNIAVVDMGGGEDADTTDALPPDLLGAAFGSKVFVVWDPRRTWDGFLFELHAGAHLTMEGIQSWTCEGAQDVISSLGGVQALIPLIRSLIAISASTDMSSTGDGKDVPLPVLSHLFELLAAFIQDHSENARELLRCGGIDIIEQLLVATKKVTVSRPRYTSLFVALSLSATLADQLVNSLLVLRSACSHYVGLETKVFSRLLFNLSLWLGGLPSTCGAALHLRLLPVLASLTQMNPEKVRDCVGVRDIVLMLKESNLVQRGEDDTANRFETENLLDGASKDKLSEPERRRVVEILFGMLSEVIASGTTPQELAPFLNFISAGIDEEQSSVAKDKTLDDGLRYEMITNACLALLVILQARPPVTGLFESFAHCCGSVHGGVAWILGVLVNSRDDTRRALGIRCAWCYVEAISRGDDLPLSVFNSGIPQESEVPATDSSTVARASSRVASLAKGLASMNTGTKAATLSPSKFSPKVVYKLMWHFLRSHYTELGPRTRLSLLSCMTNNIERFNWSLFGTLREEFSVKCHHRNVGGQYLVIAKVISLLDEPSSLVGLSLKHKLTIGTVLRLLRYLEPATMDTWLSDLIFLAQSSKQSVSLLSSTIDWQPNLFHLVSETVEQLSTATLYETAEVCRTLSRRLDLCLKLYGTLLGQVLREGGDRALDAVENAASLQRVCVNGNVVFLLALSALCADLYDHGILLEMGNMATNDWKDLDLDHDSLLLKQSAKLVTDAILSNGTKGLDITAAVRSWRCLRHLAEVVVAMVTKCGFGVVNLFDYSNQRASSVDSISNGLHGIRLADARIPGISAEQYIEFIRASGLSTNSTEANIEDAKKEINRRLSVTLTAQVLTLMDAFIFPDSLDASLPASQLHGLALVRNSEPRLGRSQGPLVASAIRLSFLLLNTLEPCSVKFLQCASRLRCLIHWALDLIRETASQEGTLPPFDSKVNLLDRLILAIALHCHRSLGRCSSLLSTIESSSYEKYFESKDSQKRHYRRLLRVALELRDVVSAAYRGRNSVLQCTLSSEAFEDLRESLEGLSGSKSPSRESLAREFLSSKWVSKYQDVEIKAELSIPEQITTNTIPLSSEEMSSELQGFAAMEKLSDEGDSIQVDFEKALNAGFELYLESQRKWAETDAVRELEYEGDTIAKKLSEKSANDASEFLKINAARRFAADNRWHGVQRKVVLPWMAEKHWKLGKFTDRHGRRILLVQNDAFDPHTDADYEASLDSTPARQETDNNDRRGSLTDLIRRNADAFVLHELASESDVTEEDSLIHDSDGESSTDLESSTDGETSDPASEQKKVESIDESEYDDEWDKIDSKEIAHVDAEGDVDGWARAFIWSENEAVVARFESIMIVSLQVYVTGKLLLTTHGLYFRQTGEEMSVMTKEPIEESEIGSESRDRRWRLSRLTEIHGRRYLLRQQAIELFFSDCHELFINFPGGVKDRDRFHAKLRNNCKVSIPRCIFVTLTCPLTSIAFFAGSHALVAQISESPCGLSSFKND